MWLKAQAIQLAQGPIKPTGSIYRAQLGVKRCSGICLLVGTSGKGLGCSLTLEPVISKLTTASFEQGPHDFSVVANPHNIFESIREKK